MKPKSYIGITGFNTVAQVKELNTRLNSYPFGYFMYGVTCSNKRLLDPTSSGKTSPSLNELPKILEEVPKHHLPMVHYFSSNEKTLHEEVVALFEYCDLACGLQLNATWPHPEQIRHIQQKLSNRYPSKRTSWEHVPITLQLPKSVLELSNNDIITGLQQYEGLISYALIDPSGGEGIDVDLKRASELLQWMQTSLETITPGVAGGFGHDNVAARIKELRNISRCHSCQQDVVKDFCIDAQGKLRTDEEIRAVYPRMATVKKQSILSVDKAITYINNALHAFCED